MSGGPLRVASFFTGIGGFDLACELAGMKVVCQSEINRFCQGVLFKQWPQVKQLGDINEIEADDLPDADVWCGGFPCQDVSLANQGKREGIGGQRSGLFFRFSELIAQRLPRWLLIENVPGLLNSHQGRDFQILVGTLDELGYCVAWRVFDAKYFGTPQRRRRVFIVASFGNIRAAEVLFEQGPTQVATRAGLGEREITSYTAGKSAQEPDCYIIQHAGIGRKHTAGPQAKGYRADGETYTLDSRGGADAVCKASDAFRMRKVAGVPSGLDGNRYRALGNAVSVPVVEWIARRLASADKASAVENDTGSG